MRIALCDDQKESLLDLHKLISRYAETSQEPITVKTFGSGKELWFNLENTDLADVFILDIEMPEFDGISLAEIIRRNQPSALIIFYTAYAEYALQGYQVDAIRYILKGSGEGALWEALDSAVDRYHQIKQKSVIISYQHMSERLLLADIVYVERSRRQLKIHTAAHGELTENKAINDFFDLLADSRFFFLDRGVFVNLDYVSRIEASRVSLTTGEDLFVSRRNAGELKTRLMNEWRP